MGIFWWLPTGGRGELLLHALPLSDAEPYGDCLTHPSGHYEVWEQWGRLSEAERGACSIPALVAEEEYETFPRGRVVYHRTDATFWVYADRRLHKPDIVRQITAAFCISDCVWLLKSDPHYR